MNLPRYPHDSPGFLWPVGVGGVSFVAGFFGPMILAPESNLGPMIGLVVSGPAGLVLGAILGLLCRLTRLPPRGQWLGLAGVCAGAFVGTLDAVQPAPATRGYLVELKVERQRPLHTHADDVVAFWRDYVSRVTWSQARPDWEEQMRRDLQTAPGTVLDAIVLRRREIKEHRKLWKRGVLVATDWEVRNEPASYYLPAAAGPSHPPGSTAIHFLANDSLARIEPPREWPPRTLLEFIHLPPLQPVPPAYSRP